MSKKLKEVFAAFVAKNGKDLAGAMAATFGSTNLGIDTVPEARRAGLAAALSRILKGGGMTRAAANVLAHGGDLPAVHDEQEDVFAGIREKAFKSADDEDDVEQPAAVKLDPAEIFARWNQSKRTA